MVLGVLAALYALPASGTSPAPPRASDPAAPLPVEGTLGRLPNGLTYYVRENRFPEALAELRLVVDVGSVLEETEQRGYAHFVEHLAFAGTKRYSAGDLARFFGEIGSRSGQHLNATTDFDETVYKVQVPTQKPEVLEQALDILREWASDIGFSAAAVTRERGVILRETGSGHSSTAPVFKLQFPVLVRGSRYANRLPSGSREVVEQASPESLRSFYQSWYRPELMAVIAVGDFDGEWMEDRVRALFSSLPADGPARERPSYPVPGHPQTTMVIAPDPEAPFSVVNLAHKHDLPSLQTVGDYRRHLIAMLFHRILNERLDRLSENPDSPLLAGFSSSDVLVRGQGVTYLSALTTTESIPAALQHLLEEAERIKRHGFPRTETEHHKSALLLAMENAWRDRQHEESETLADEYVAHFLDGEPVPGIELEYALARRMIPEIQGPEIAALATGRLRDQNRVLMVSVPAATSAEPPGGATLAAVLEAVKTADVAPGAPWPEDGSPLPKLVDSPPQPGKIVQRVDLPAAGIIQWRLSNGVLVVLRPTDFNPGEVLMTAFSPGGLSLVPAADYPSAVAASSILVPGGVGAPDHAALQRTLAAKKVHVSPWINELSEGLQGACPPPELDILLQLVYLYFTVPRSDPEALSAFRERMVALSDHRAAAPRALLEEALQREMSQDHPRRRALTTEMLRSIDPDTSLAIYRDRFADASDFTFVFVGSFDPAPLEPLVLRYLGGLAATHRKETWKNLGVERPTGIVKKVIRADREPQSSIRLVFNGAFSWNPRNVFEITAMARLLQQRLEDTLRGVFGEVYSVATNTSTTRFPDGYYTLDIGFAADPRKADQLIASVFDEVGKLRDAGPSEIELAALRAELERKRAEELRSNDYWLATLQSYYFTGEDPAQIVNSAEWPGRLSKQDVRRAARMYLDPERYVQIQLLPVPSAATGMLP